MRLHVTGRRGGKTFRILREMVNQVRDADHGMGEFHSVFVVATENEAQYIKDHFFYDAELVEKHFNVLLSVKALREIRHNIISLSRAQEGIRGRHVDIYIDNLEALLFALFSAPIRHVSMTGKTVLMDADTYADQRSDRPFERKLDLFIETE